MALILNIAYYGTLKAKDHHKYLLLKNTSMIQLSFLLTYEKGRSTSIIE
jgi:hypothetical protein